MMSSGKHAMSMRLSWRSSRTFEPDQSVNETLQAKARGVFLFTRISFAVLIISYTNRPEGAVRDLYTVICNLGLNRIECGHQLGFL